MSASSRTPRLQPDTERWLQELTKDLPPDLIDPRELEEPPEDPFKKQLRDVSRPSDEDLGGAVDTPFSADDADLLDAATDEQPPTPPVRRKPRARERVPRSSATAKPKESNESDGFGEPSGYFARYDDFDDLESDEMPPQTGAWKNNVRYGEEEKRRVRLLQKAASERLRRARMKEKTARMYTDLRF